MGKKPKIKICFFTCLHERPELSELFLQNYSAHVRKYSARADFHLVAAVSDLDSRILVECFGNSPDHNVNITLHECDNKPVGKKWNAALATALSSQPDAQYYVKADDDGMVSSAGMLELIKAMEEGYEYIGFRGELFVHPGSKRAAWFEYPIESKCMGTLKAYSQRAIFKTAVYAQVEFIQDLNTMDRVYQAGDVCYLNIMKAEWLTKHGYVRFKTMPEQGPKLMVQLWENRWNRNLDWCSDLRLGLAGVVCHTLKTDAPALLNVKSDGKNIWSFDMRAKEGQPYAYADIEALIPAQQWQILQEII